MKTQNQNDHCFKILVLGDSSVGKTSLITRYTEGFFQLTHVATLGIDFKVKFVTLDSKKIKVELWDTAGQERFRSLSKNYFKGAHGFIFIYDVTKEKTFEGVKSWITQAKSTTHLESYQMIIVGNKCDCSEDEREIMIDELKEEAKKNNCEYIETSAKEDINVKEMFNTLISNLTANADSLIEKEPAENKGNNKGVRLTANEHNNKANQEEKKKKMKC